MRKLGLKATDACDGQIDVTCTPGLVTDVGTCGKRQVFTYAAVDQCLNRTAQDVVYTWKVDETGPALPTLPSGGDLGCNPTLPTCTLGLKATDACDGQIDVTCTPGLVTDVGTCGKRQVFTYAAVDQCLNRTAQDVVYTWKVDETGPVLPT